MDNHRPGKDLVKRTAKLEKELSAKTHELEIEAALEKVRTVAMRMNKPGDLPGVCKTLYKQFLLLGFSEMRNAMVNIHNDADKSFINYDYSCEIGKSTNQLTYNIHPLIEKQIKKIRSADDAFSETYFSGEDLVEWRKFRKRIGEKDDPRLRKTKGLYYYFYSIGTGSIGISTFGPISKEKRALLKRFRNVFNLSYQRYIDIAKAEAQAREAQIQLALERVRARTMAMQKSDELPETAAILFEQFKSLGQELMQMTIGIVNEAAGVIEFSVTDWSGSGAGVHRAFNLSIEEPSLIKKMYSGWKENKKSIVVDLTGKDLENWISYRNKMSGVTVNSADTGGRRVITSAFFSKGHLSVSTPVLPVDGSIQLLERFAQVFDLTYTRFLDLKQAEELARESQIQLALERVRARTMAMQRSDELVDAASLLFKQLEDLGIKSWSSGFNIWQDDGRSATINMCNPDGSITTPYYLPHTEDIFFIRICEARKRGEDLLVMETGGKELEDTYNYMFSMPEVKKVLGAMEDTGFQIPKFQVNHCAFFSQGYLMFITYEPVPEMWDVFKRLAKVFEQTYTRFLDLQKAEAQARESQIQLALERVRARTMAMQKSDELAEAARVLYEEFRTLNINSFLCGYCFYKEEQDKQTVWVTFPDGTIIPDFIDFPITGDHILNKRYEDWKQKKPLHVLTIQGEENKEHHRFLASKVSDQAANEIFAQIPDRIIVYGANFSTGYLFIIATELLTGEEEDVIIRFAKVFELTYTRFNDLKQAEAQARESQIQLALERVRARTMAMQKSDELMEASNLLLQQVQSLGIPVWACGYNIWEIGEKVCTAWMSVLGAIQPSFRLPLTEHRTFIHMYESRRKAEPFYVEEVSGEELADHYRYMFSLPDFKEIATKQLQGGDFPLPQSQTHHVFNFKHGNLIFLSAEAIPEALDIFKRFTAVFEQTYTRFLDLQKAEAQARQAQIEASLERVRASAMAMHRSDELSNVLAILFEQFDVLKIQPVDVHLDLFDLEKNTFSYRATGKEGKRVIAEQIVDLDSRPEWHALLQKWKKGKPNTVDFSYYPKEVIRELMAFFPDIWAAMPGDAIMSPEDFPDGIFDALGFCKFGYIGFHHHRKATEEEQKILVRFANEFERLYQRFLDLQKAEAQAREAQIELGLERVRARAMAMQKSDELSELVDTVFKELTKLDFALTWCIINIIDEPSLSNMVWAANPDIDKAPDSYHMKFEDYPFHHAMMKGWKERRTKYMYVLEGTEKKIYDKYLFNETEFRKVPEAAQAASSAMEKYVVSFSFSNFGGLQTVGDVPLSDANLDILSRFGKVFDLTYTRFNDLKQAEEQARESQIQLALERVRARTMAMQKSDELADAASVLFKQVNELGIKTWSTGFEIWNTDGVSYTSWMTDPTGSFLPPIQIPLYDFWLFKQVNNAKKRGEEFLEIKLDNEQTKEGYEYLASLPATKGIFDAGVVTGIEFPKSQVDNYVFFSQGNLLFITYEPCPEAWDIFKRFAKVFEQTYTRFLDLQKAEAQAKESQIQLALERVRARTMAMQKQNDLLRVLDLLVEQLVKLGVDLQVANFSKGLPGGDWDLWIEVVTDDGTIFNNYVHFPRIDHPYFHHVEKNIETFRNDGTDFFKDVFSKEEKNSWQDYIYTQTIYKDLTSEEIKQSTYEKPGYTWSMVILKDTWVSICRFNQTPFSDEEDALLRRFANAFGQAYTRFLDLQTAEAQARESQIQLALERVRARTMAMQRSDELGDAASLLFKQIADLGTRQWSSGFDIWNANEVSAVAWMSNPDGSMGKPFNVPYTEDPFFKKIYEARQRGEDFFVMESSGKELEETYQYMFNLPGVKEYFDDALDSGFAIPKFQITHCAFFAQGYVMFITYEPVTEMHDIFKRFAKVFEQTYTRFLDLQKAEAQAREAKIEAALEKVRSRTMAMQRSEELANVATVLFQQVKALGVSQWTCGFSIFEIDDKEFTWYPGSAEGDILLPVKIPLTEHPVFISFNESRKRGDELYVYEKGGEYQTDHYRYMRSLPGGEEMYQNTLKAGLTFPAFQIDHIANFSHGNLVFITYEPFPEMHDVFKRFAKVFDQTYTRFLDLQKAEAQAREAQIEAALERVRSRSMGMQKSEELKEVIQVVYEQFVHLNMNVEHTGFVMDYKTRDDYDIWIADQLGVPSHVTIPYFDSVYYNRFNEAKKKGEDFFATNLDFEEKNRFYKKIIEYVPGLPEESKEFLFSIPGLAASTVLLDNVCLYIENFSGIPYSDEENNTLMRFGKVFQQTYTRFLDLQKAEAQAREAKIETALEKVRSRTMAMHESDELQEVVNSVYKRLNELQVEMDGAAICTFIEGSKDYNVWIGDYQQPLRIRFNEFTLIQRDYNDAIERREELFTNTYSGEIKKEYIQFLLEQTVLGINMPTEQKQLLLASAFFTTSLACTKNTVFQLYRYAEKSFSKEENDILKRFANVFEQSYTRFLDLQKAEAQALEAVKRASVDRVRAEIASMRTTNDLERITPLIWNELTTLGVPFVRCGVFIMDEEKQLVETHLSTPDGKAIASFTSTFSGTQLLTEILPYWQRREIYKAHWDEARFLEQAKSLVQQGSITSGEKYLTENRPTDLYLHFLPFLQGMLYAGNTAPLSDDELQLMQNLADAFSTAYARYEDFNKLEVAKEQIEKTLVDLKQAQQQLVQSEKMASLGELTAGIAHEIQNPLNFVNNFSDVNKELLEELKEEADKGNIEEIKAIANDVINNEEKINHHGKRADAIVKNMLQHSRSSGATKELTDINKLADEYLRLSYHGLRAKDKNFNADFKTDLDNSIGKINIIPQDIGRVFLNLINNAFYAVGEKEKLQASGLPTGQTGYKPQVIVRTRKFGDRVEIDVEDNGNGISQKVVDKIFQPFFTTKPTGQGTGLGLSLSYDIVKTHGGEIKVETKEGEGSKFVIQLPIV